MLSRYNRRAWRRRRWYVAAGFAFFLVALFADVFPYVHAQAMGAKPQISADQLRVVAATSSTSLLKMQLLATDGTNFYLVTSASPLSFSLGTNGTLNLRSGSSESAVVYPILNLTMARQTDGSYVSPVAPGVRALRVWRNGMLVLPELSYTVDDANASRVIPSSVWSDADTVVCDLLPVQ